MSVKLSDSQIQALQARVVELEADNQRLRQSESHYRQVFENTPIGKNRTDQERERLLSTVAEVANRLLRAPDYGAVLPEVVRLLGEATGCDRCAITQEFVDSTTHQPGVRLLHEWCRDEIPSVLLGSPEFEQGIGIDSPPSFYSRLVQGESVNFVVSELPELPWQQFFEAHGNTSMLIVPVMLGGHCWGHIGFDNCGEPRLHDAAEIAILQVASESIAAAIERQAKDDALRESKRRFQELFENSNDGIYFSNFNQPIPLSLPIEEQIDLAYQSFQFVNVNSACANMFGFDRPDEMIGKYLGDVHSPNSNHRNLLRHLSQNGWNVSNLESDDLDEHGNKRYWLSHLFSTIEDGHLVRGWGIANNITELRQAQQALLEAEQAKSQELERLNAQLRESERRYRTLFELSNEGIYRFEFEEPIALALSPEERLRLGYRVNRLAEVNQAFAEQYGCTSPDEMVGTRIGDFYDEAYSQADDQANLTLMRDLRVSDLETVETDSLSHRHWFISSLVCETCDGYIVGGWGVQTDITELKQAQQALLEAEQAKSQELEVLNAELRQTLTELEGRDLMLSTVAEATKDLLNSSNTDLEQVIPAALRVLGEGLECDRVGVLENFGQSSTKPPDYQTVIYEWAAPGTVPQISHPEAAQVSNQGLDEYTKQYLQNDGFGGLIDEFPEPLCSVLKAADIQSSYSVPIWLGEEFWGILGFDYCREAKQFSPSEVAVLRTAAACIGGAIQRDRTQKAILQAEKARAAEQARNEVLQQRDRLLNASATSVSALLTVEDLDDAINQVLKTIGEALDTDRAGVVEFFGPEDLATSLPHWRLLYEWHTLDTPSQLADPTANQGTSDGIEDIYARLEQGDVFSAAIEDCSEPFRSQMATIGVQAMHYVPIFVEGQCWGLLGFDDCRGLKDRSSAELSILSIAADCLGSAIQRQRTQQTLQQTEQARAVEQARNEVLQQRDLISEATAAATNALLTVNTLDDAIDSALQIIGTALDIDRVAVLEHFFPTTDSSLAHWRVLYEWDEPGVVSQIDNSHAAQGTYEGIEDWYESLSQGKVLSYLLEELPEPFRSGQREIGVKALHGVPIMIDGQFWGTVGIDNCREAKRISEAELSVLKVAADCIGSAIQRERTQRSLQQAEQARIAEQARNEVLIQRDRMLDASATSVSALLTVEDLNDAINLVLKTVGEALDTDRAGVIEFFDPEDSAAALPHWRLLHEWHKSDIPSQLAHSATAQGTHDGIEDIYALLEQGNFFSTAIEDCGEPFRSQQLAIGVKAIHYVPIFVESDCWGILTFDDCREVKHRSPAELSVLSIAADCVGSAIQRQRSQQTLQQTEQARAVEQARAEVLEQRDRILTTVAEATKDLLNSSNTDLEQVIPAALRMLGEGLGCDRVNVLENFGQSATQVPDHTKVIYGWAEPDTVTQLPHPDATQIDCEGLEAFTGQYLQNNGFGGLVDDWPEPLRSAFKAVDMQSSYSVPIWLGEKFWGIVSFDYCHEAKQVSPAEMAILRTAAACIGGAIQRDRTQKAILQTEQAQVAKLMKTNQALKNNLDRLAAESSLDAFLGHVLTEISQQLNIQTVWFYLYEPIDQTLQLHRWVEQGEVQPPANFSQLGPMVNPIAVANLPIWEHLKQTKTPFVITADNAEQAEQFMFSGTQDWQLQWAKQNNIQSGINILLMVGETPLGLLGLLSAQRSEYTSEELALVQALAHQATLAMQLTRLADEAKQATLYEERSRLAGEIHDTLAQTFTGISVQLELAQYLIGQSAKDGDHTEVGSTLERIGSLAQTGLAEARRSVWSLYPATEDYTKLAERLANCIATLAQGTDLFTQVDLKGDPYPLNYFVGKNLLRIGQEAITNTFRHAQATELWVELTYAPNQVSLQVRDNGCGFVPQAQAEGFGLVSISERADRIGGQLRITTQSEQGTEIFVQVPL